MQEQETSASRPSVKDVAHAAGVSVGTVSNVLNRPDQVSATTRKRVERAVSDLGFVRDPYARALRGGALPIIGVAVLDLTNPFFMEAASGVDERLSAEGCVMALSSTHSDVAEESQLLEALARQRVRGILLAPTDPELTMARQLIRQGTKIVLFDSTLTPSDISSVAVDDQAGARMAIDHLIELGHRNIAFVNGPQHVRQAIDRMQGVSEAAESAVHEVELQCFTAKRFTARAGREVATSIMSEVPGWDATTGSFAGDLPNDFPTAVFCANDQLALGVSSVLQDAGIGIPESVSIVGFDDTSIVSQLAVPLTTVRQPMRELGWAGADLLLSDATPIRHRRFTPELIIRRSTQAPRA